MFIKGIKRKYKIYVALKWKDIKSIYLAFVDSEDTPTSSFYVYFKSFVGPPWAYIFIF